MNRNHLILAALVLVTCAPAARLHAHQVEGVITDVEASQVELAISKKKTEMHKVYKNPRLSAWTTCPRNTGS